MSSDPIKIAKADHPILPAIAARFSPYVFEARSVEKAKLLTCLEAARWAASSFNEQPWSFILALREDKAEFAKALACLGEPNQVWAKDAGALILTVISKTFSRNGTPNRVAEHDLGQAAANMAIQAAQEGLQIHQMAGVNLTSVRQGYAIPATHEPMTAIAVGYAADPAKAAGTDLGSRDAAARGRKPLSEWVFTGGWKQPAKEVR